MASDTLKILRLPPHLSNERREELFEKYGATKTTTIRRSDNYTVSFAKFPSKQAATDAFLQLHQLEIRGRYLAVEFARKSVPTESTENERLKEETESIDDGVKKKSIDRKHFQEFVKKLNGWTSNNLFSQPPPPNLCYKYSLPTKNTLLRIAIQLIKEPAFYTQVLHLMNKMNLPPPFEELDAEFPMLREAYDIDKYKDIFGNVRSERDEIVLPEEDDEESELESNGEDDTNPIVNIPVKRIRTQSRKRLKIPKFVNPAKQTVKTNTGQKILKPEDMFESVERGEGKNRKIELKPVKMLDNDVRIPELGSSSTTDAESGFGLMFPTKTDNYGDVETAETKDSQKSEKEFITSEELAANRISIKDQRLLPVFKNYHAGKPSSRLYIKNLAKQVEPKDLHYIYRRYVISSVESCETSENRYDVRLMQEGRMKGQAFVTFQNMGQAQLALKDTNGFILKDKPMVVQFAKSVSKNE